jgi:hypothetical protein
VACVVNSQLASRILCAKLAAYGKSSTSSGNRLQQAAKADRSKTRSGLAAALCFWNPSMTEYTSVAEQVQFGLDQIDPSRTVEVSLRDLVFVYKTIGELKRFFHQPMHYERIEQVLRFLGTRDHGAFGLIADCYYEKLRDVFPQDIIEGLEEGALYPEKYPEYYDPNYAK